LNKGIRKAIVCSLLVGTAQFGLNSSVLEASPRSDMQQRHDQRQLQEKKRHNQEMRRQVNESAQNWNDRQWRENQQHGHFVKQDNERQYRNELEMKRHEQEMQRREWENDQAWNDRKWRENQNHDQIVRQIEADV